MKTFEAGKTIAKLGIDIKKNRKFIVVEEGRNFNKGDILTLLRDDDTSCPLFTNQYWREDYTSLGRLAYLEEKILPRTVYVSSVSEKDALERKNSSILMFELPEHFHYRYICTFGWGSIEDADYASSWKFIVEIPEEDERVKMTLSEIEEALGKKIEIISN